MIVEELSLPSVQIELPMLSGSVTEEQRRQHQKITDKIQPDELWAVPLLVVEVDGRMHPVTFNTLDVWCRLNSSASKSVDVKCRVEQMRAGVPIDLRDPAYTIMSNVKEVRRSLGIDPEDRFA